MDHHRQAGLGQHNIGSGTGGISCAGHSDTDVGTLQGRGIIHTVAGHAHSEALLAQRLHNQVLVLCNTAEGGAQQGGSACSRGQLACKVQLGGSTLRAAYSGDARHSY